MRMLVQILALLALGQSLSCNYDGMDNTVTVGDEVVVCLHFEVTDGTGVLSKRIAYKVKVDTYTALKSSGVFSVTNSSSTKSITLQFKASTLSVGYLQLVSSKQYVADMHSFIIRTTNGVVEGIEEQNSVFCSGCTGQCIDSKNCFKEESATANDNDPKIFLSWIGTDAAGNYMLSQTKRLSRFTQYSVSDVYTQAVKLFTS